MDRDKLHGKLLVAMARVLYDIERGLHGESLNAQDLEDATDAYEKATAPEPFGEHQIDRGHMLQAIEKWLNAKQMDLVDVLDDVDDTVTVENLTDSQIEVLLEAVEEDRARDICDGNANPGY